MLFPFLFFLLLFVIEFEAGMDCWLEIVAALLDDRRTLTPATEDLRGYLLGCSVWETFFLFLLDLAMLFCASLADIVFSLLSCSQSAGWNSLKSTLTESTKESLSWWFDISLNKESLVFWPSTLQEDCSIYKGNNFNYLKNRRICCWMGCGRRSRLCTMESYSINQRIPNYLQLSDHKANLGCQY